MPEPAAKETDAQLELRGVLDTEMSRLPDRYRAVIVLCDLEGKTRKEAARQLGCPEGTVAGHLARGRAMLARKLRRHGLCAEGGAAAVLAEQASAVPPSLVASTVTSLSVQAIPPKVALLAQGVIKAMLVTKLKKMLAVMLVLALTLTGVTYLAGRPAGQDDRRSAEKPMTPAAKQPMTAWGEPVGGLQAGLSVRPDRKVYYYGETVTLVVRVRNISKQPVKLKYIGQFLVEKPPTVTESGKAISQLRIDVPGSHAPVEVTLQPGKEIELDSRLGGGGGGVGAPGFRYVLLPADNESGASQEHPLFVPTGKVALRYEQVIGNSSSGRMELDPVLTKLSTGKLELQVQDAKKREPGTAWGKQVDGLQAGIRLRAIDVLNAANQWEARPPAGEIPQGGDLRFVVLVRNVSKEEVQLRYTQPSGWPCSEDGRDLKFSPAYIGGKPIWYEKTLKSGETWEVAQLNITTRKPMPTESYSGLRLLRLGTFRVSCPSVLLQQKEGKLATGEVEIDIISPNG